MDYIAKSTTWSPIQNFLRQMTLFVASKVVNFYNGVNNARLLHIPLTNRCTTKGKYKARGSTIRKKGDDDRENKSSLLMMVVLKRVIFFTSINWGSIVDCFFNSSFIDVYFFQSSSLNDVYSY